MTPETESRPVDANGNAIYRVPEANLDGLKARIEKMNKRAAKLRMEPLVLSEVGEEFEQRTIRHETEQRTKCVTIRVVLVTLTGTCPRVNGWAMAATIQHEEGGNILRTVPGFETLLPMQYRTAGTVCEHCSTNRTRKDTYVLQSESGDWKQVGRNCLADFLRTSDASGIAEWAEMLASLDEFMGEFEDSMECGTGRNHYFRAQTLLAQVACCVRSEGWCSRTEARNSFEPKTATVDGAIALFDSKVWDKLSAADQARLTPTEADEQRAASAIEWAQALAADVANDYLWNIRVVSHKEQISYREAGLAGSIIAAYNRHMEQELAKKYERDHPSEWFGEIGKRDVFTLTVIGTRELESDYGLTTLVMFRDANGNKAKWFCSGSTAMELDTAYTVKATVKGHDEYKEAKQTTLSRVVVYDAAAEAANKAALKAARKAIKGKYECPHENQFRNFPIPELEELGAKYAQYVPCCDVCIVKWAEAGRLVAA